MVLQVIEDEHHLPETFYYTLGFLPYNYNDMPSDICRENDKMAKSGSTYYVTLHTTSDIIAYLKDKEKMKTLPPFALPPPPTTALSTNEDAPQTPKQALALLGTSPVTEAVNNGVAIACDIAEE
eukprot:15324377-Ditylum_brightwellii.AAC.1